MNQLNLSEISIASGSARRNSEFNESQRKTRILDLEKLYRPIVRFAAGLGGLLSSLWKIIVSIIQRVASKWGVAVNTPDSAPSLDFASAEFVDSSGSTDADSRLESAAGQASFELTEFVAKIINCPPDVDSLKAPHGDTYLNLVLMDLGSTLNSLRENISKKQDSINEIANEMSVSIGGTPDGLISLVESWGNSSPSGSSLMSHPRAAEFISRIGKIQADKSNLLKTQFSFCDHSIAALRANTEDAPLYKTSLKKIDEYADESMRAVIFSEVKKTEESLPREYPDAPKSNILDSPSVTSNTGVQANTFFKKVGKSRAGMSAGYVGEPTPPSEGSADDSDDSGGGHSHPRMRG